MLTRRTFLQNVLRASAGLTYPFAAKAADARVSLSLRLADISPTEVPRSFTGIGYEMSSVATPGLLRISNRRYIELIRGLGPEGVLRVGGIVANYSRYEPNGEPAFDRHNTVITRTDLKQFAKFLSTIGWRAIWSVNFAQGTIEQAVEEARAVAAILGPNLLALEVGNEVNSYGKGQPFRPPSYDYTDYLKQFEKWHAAIAKAVPSIHFAAPDTTGGAVDWVERMAKDAKGEVQLLTTHYYRNGQSRGSAEQLLLPDPKLTDVLVRLRTASQESGIPWRMCEINSFSGGGRPGVSDTFIGTLWTLKTMLLLAQYGCAGVNMETGVNQLGFVSCYSPIQDDGKGLNSEGPPYYGMLAFATAFAGCHQLLPLDAGGGIESLHAYVLGAHGKPRSVVVVNMDSTMVAQVSVANLNIKHAAVLRLDAPTVDRKAGVMFGGSQVDQSGQWKAGSEERMSNGQVAVAPMSAAVLLAAHAS